LIANATLFAGLFVMVYLIPGWLMLGPVPPRERVGSFALASGVGLATVSLVVVLSIGLVGLTGPWCLDRAWILGVSVLIALPLLALRRGSLGAMVRALVPSRASVALGAITSLAFLFYLYRYDASQVHEDTCMIRSAVTMLIDWQEPGRSVNDFLLVGQGQRLGPAVVIGPFLGLFGVFGVRLVYALQGLLLPGLGYLLGRWGCSERWAPWVTAILLTFSPYALEIRIFDENFMALCFGTLTLVLLRRHPALAAAACALFLGIRHVGLLCLPFLLWTLGRQRNRWAVLRFVVVLAVCCTPYVIRHLYMGLTMGMWFEGTQDRLPAPHTFLGLEFMSAALWNFPFVPEPLRSHYVAYPNLFAFPLDLIRRFGVLSLAAVPLGWVALARRDRSLLVLGLGWFFPILLLVMLKSNWIEPNKMGIPASVLGPLVLWIVAGLGLLLRMRPWWALLCLLVPVLGWVAMSPVRAPLDERIRPYWTERGNHVVPEEAVFLTEHPAYIEWDRARHRLAWLPAIPPLPPPSVARYKLSQLMDSLRNPGMDAFEQEPIHQLVQHLTGHGWERHPLSLYRARGGDRPGLALYQGSDPMVPVLLDLEQPPLLSEHPVMLGGEGVLALDRALIVQGLEVSWSDLPVNLLAARDPLGAVHLLFLSLDATVRSTTAIPVVDGVEGTSLSLAVPAGAPLRLWEIRTHFPRRLYSRWMVVDGEVVLSSPAEALFF
jgi:hypothetical protein